jgi:hypothetical protein
MSKPGGRRTEGPFWKSRHFSQNANVGDKEKQSCCLVSLYSL